ncbi:hypothetical protein MBLNU457_4601t1 [Dothideomycetes sp. NU457]
MSSPSDHDRPSETSPLLPKDPLAAKQLTPVDPSDGLAPDAGQASAEAVEDGAALEQQTSAEGRQKQYEGMPEIRKQMKYIMPALAIGVFLSAADQTLIVSSYGKIGSDLKALNNTSWIATAYFLTLTSFQPLYGKLSDIFGRKSCLLFGYVVFGLGCLFCGLAQDMNQLIAARAFAGIGGGGMTTVVSIILSDAISLRERGQWQGYINIIYAAGAGTGAPLGGILADSIGWRWAFMFQAPLCLVAVVAVSLVLKLPKIEAADWRTKLRRIDFLGAVILIGAVFTLLLALDRGSNVSWKATITIVSLSVSIPLFALFIFVEMKVAKEPFAPGHIIFDRSLFACYLCNFFSFSGWIAAIFYIPLYFQAVEGMSATQAGIRLVPSTLFGVSGSLSAGYYMRKTGRYYWITVICYAFLVVGLVIVLLFSGIVSHSEIGIIIGTCVCSFSNGTGVTTSLIGLISNASREDQAVATACSYLFRSLGSVFGISISATVANQALKEHLKDELSSGKAALEIADRVRRNLDYIKTLTPEMRAVVADCYARSTRAAFGVEIGLVAGAAIAAWFIREKSLGK